MGAARARKHKKILKSTRGQIGAASRRYRVAREAWLRAGQYATIGRKLRKRDFRQLWITRISAACRQRGISYSRFINALAQAEVTLNRKILADIAVADPAAFDEILAIATSAKQPAPPKAEEPKAPEPQAKPEPPTEEEPKAPEPQAKPEPPAEEEPKAVKKKATRKKRAAPKAEAAGAEDKPKPARKKAATSVFRAETPRLQNLGDRESLRLGLELVLRARRQHRALQRALDEELPFAVSSDPALERLGYELGLERLKTLPAGVRPPNLEMAARMTVTVLDALTRMACVQYPEYLDSDEFVDEATELLWRFVYRGDKAQREA